MEENKLRITWRELLPEFLSLILTGAGIWAICFFRQKTEDVMLSNMVLGIAGAAIVGYCLRQAYVENELDYDNEKHYFRFWACYLLGLAGAFVCAYLPVRGWPFVPVFVLLSLFSNLYTGIIASAVLLMIPTLLTGAAAPAYFLYFLSGIFAVTLFRHLEDNFKIGVRLILSLLCLFLCETAGIILLENQRPDFEAFVIPGVNIIISGILLVGILKFFSATTIYKNHEKYLDLNDTENPLLAEYRNASRENYMQSIHTAYFCERIANKLSMNAEVLKCVGYYHKLCEEKPDILEEQLFPKEAAKILSEYLEKKSDAKSRETAVLICSATCMNTIQQLMAKSNGKGLDYDYIIDSMFKHFAEDGTFAKCEVTVREIEIMREIFKKEKLYYDFLR